MMLLCFQRLDDLAWVSSLYLFPFLALFISFFSKGGGEGFNQPYSNKSTSYIGFFFCTPLGSERSKPLLQSGAKHQKLPLTALFTQQTSEFGFVCSTKQKGLGTNPENPVRPKFCQHSHTHFWLPLTGSDRQFLAQSPQRKSSFELQSNTVPMAEHNRGWVHVFHSKKTRFWERK